MQKAGSIRIYFLMLLVPLFWGGAFVAGKHVLEEIPPLTTAALRFGAAGVILLVIAILRSEVDLKAIKKQWLNLLLMSVIGIFGYNAFFFIALDLTSAINGSLIMATTPVFLTLGAVVFLGEQENKQLIYGISLSLFGVIVVITEGSLSTLIGLQFNAGDLLFLGALFSWVLHGLFAKVIMRDVSPLLTTTTTTMIGSMLLFIVSLLFEDGWSIVPQMSTQAWTEMVFMIVCASVVAFLLWNYGINKIGASKSSIYMNLVPINTAWLSVFLYSSKITFVQIFGMIMVIIGVYFVTLHGYVMNKRRLKMYRRQGVQNGTRN